MLRQVDEVALRVDHVVVEAGDEEQLFSFFTHVLGLPVAWPVAQWGSIHEGGVGVGNCNLGCNHVLDPNSDPVPTVRAVALEPAAELTLIAEELERRGLSPTEPMPSGPIDMPEGEEFDPWRRGFTNVMVLGGPLDPLPFICAYDHDVIARHHADQVAFDSTAGGPLGITCLRAVVIHSDDVDRDIAAWCALLGERSKAGHDVLALRDGPELRFRSGLGPPALVFGVRSVSAAVAEARNVGIRCQSGEQVRLDRPTRWGWTFAWSRCARPAMVTSTGSW